MFEELFELFQKSLHDYATLVPLDTRYEFYFSDGSTFTYRGDIDHTLQEIARFNEADVAGYQKLLALSKRFSRLALSSFPANLSPNFRQC